MKKNDGKSAPPLLQSLSNFWKINPTQKIAVLVALAFMGVVSHYGHLYETRKPYEITLEAKESLCPNKTRAGDAEDGGWWICSSSTIPTSDCVVYSFGIRDNFSFDHYLANRGCQVHGFDPSPYGLPSKEAYEKVEQAHYHSYGLGFVDQKYGVDRVPFRWPGLGYLQEGNTAEWQLYTLPTILNQLHHTSLTILKIDIEGGEWDTMSDVLNTHWQELYLELHFPPAEYLITKTSEGDLHIARTPNRIAPKGAKQPARNSPGKIDRINILARIAQVADVFYWENNNNCQPAFAAECIEIYFKRRENVGTARDPPLPNKLHMVD